MRKYIFLLLFGVIFSFVQCTMNEIDVNVTPSANSGLHIIGAAADFDNHKVGTRAESEFSDSFISEMTMFVFKADGTLLQGLDANRNPISSAINIPQSNPTFLIETNKYRGTGIISSMGASLNMKYFNNIDESLSACSIYIVANAYHQIAHLIDSDDSNGEIKSLGDLNEAILNIDNTLTMPIDANGNHIGFPMIGHAVTPNEEVATFNLVYGKNVETNAVANIPLIKLYSKVYFAMQINSNQIVTGGPTPKFTIDRAEVYNVPTKARMGAYTDEYISTIGNDYQFISGTENPEPFVIEGNSFSNKTIYHTTSKDIAIGLSSPDLIEFYFYMPEHKVLKNNINPYPNNLPPERKQYYKPKFVGAGTDGTGLNLGAKTATFVRIYGSYTDHNGRIKNVSYDIYLGQDEIDDFEVKRNQQLINYLVITGTTNHKDAYLGGTSENISIDHRVTVTDRGYNVYMEREAILDSHFEVRPVDFELQNGSALTIVIPDECRSWIAMEADVEAQHTYTNKGLYIDNTNEKRGVRKYFTTNLVSELTNVSGHSITTSDQRRITTESGTITLEHSSRLGGANTNTERFRVWFYIDENPNVYDKTGTGKQSSESGDYTVSKTLYRNAPVKLYYTNIATNNPDIDSEAVHTINFQQWNLWRVWSQDGKRYYDIEHEEEYLNNYASNEGYGPKQNGMPYGLEGIQLSERVLAYWLEKVSHQTGGGSTINSIINWIVSGLDNLLNISNSSKSIFSKSGKEPYYDFYLTRDAFPVDKLESTVDKTQYARDYQGRAFNEEIITTLLTAYKNDNRVVLNGVHLNNTDLKSAIAYVYNKNKRDAEGNVCIINDDGTVDTNNLKWYLPAIDEIEDIALGAYDEFDKVFQNKKYWSCQPAYELNKIIIEPSSSSIEYYKYNTMEGDFFNDNTSRARATSVYTNGTVYSNIESGLPNNLSSGKLTSRVNVKVDIGWTGVKVTQNGDPITQWESSNVDYSDPIFANPNGAYRGNTPRSESCRIRAVYRSGTAAN